MLSGFVSWLLSKDNNIIELALNAVFIHAWSSLMSSN